jgi:hypothetical protein
MSSASEALAPQRRWLRAVVFVIGVGLLIAAVAVLVSRHQTLTDALAAIADRDAAERARLVSLMLLAVAANIVLTGAMFSMLMSRFGRVGVIEMQALIAGATLLNYLPLRPGILGRVAYHRSVNGIAIASSVRTIVQAAIISAVVAGMLSLLVLLARSGAVESWRLVSGCVALGGFMAALSRGSVRVLFMAGIVRLADVLVTALRYHAAFALIGAPIDASGAIAFACISVLATMVPLVSNGLGLREWAIGLLAPAIASHHMELGITADLVNRAAELIVVSVAGVPATLWLMRRARQHAGAPRAVTPRQDHAP